MDPSECLVFVAVEGDLNSGFYTGVGFDLIGLFRVWLLDRSGSGPAWGSMFGLYDELPTFVLF